MSRNKAKYQSKPVKKPNFEPLSEVQIIEQKKKSLEQKKAGLKAEAKKLKLREDSIYAEIRDTEANIEKIENERKFLKKIQRNPEIIYGIFNVKDLGAVLAYLTTQICDDKFNFEIYEREQVDDARYEKIEIYAKGRYTREEAAIVQKYDSHKECAICSYVFAVGPYPNDDKDWDDMVNPYSEEKNWGMHNYHCFKLRKLNEKQQFTSYNSETKKFSTIYYKKEPRLQYIDKIPIFVKDFLLFLSNYRLENNLVSVTLEEMKSIADIFIMNNKEKYKEYKSVPAPERSEPQIDDCSCSRRLKSYRPRITSFYGKSC